MSKFREALLDRMIAIYGLEHRLTVEFGHLCEQWDAGPVEDSALEVVVQCHERYPMYED